MTDGSDQKKDAGTHEYELDVNLQDYPDVIDQSAKIKINLFEHTNDVSISDKQITLGSEGITVEVPKIQMNPPLHQSFDSVTGAKIDTVKILASVTDSKGDYQSIEFDPNSYSFPLKS